VSAVETRGSARGVRARAALPVAVGIGALLLRLRIVEAPDGTRFVLLVAIYAAILASSLLVRVRADQARLRPPLVLAMGLVAVVLAALAAGRPIAAPIGAAAALLSILAAVAEEALFRRAAYGSLERYGVVTAVIGSAVLFALIHVPLYGVAALPVDLGAGLLFSWQRWASGSWSVPATTHAAANLLAVILR
jgi:membrane protease YdiL (CAAX protease family)